MALIGLHNDWLKGSYKEDRDFIIRMGENDKLYKGVKLPGESWVFGTKPYTDGSIAIGYGFDLLKNTSVYIAHFLGTVGISVTAAQIDTIKYKPGGATLADFAFLNLGGEATARQLMVNVLDSQDSIFKGKEALLDAFLQRPEINIPLGDSKERAVLVSMYYQSAKYFGTTASPSNMVRSLQDGNRAEAWYEIRYGSSKNGADGNGVVKRRFAESELFGLYGDSAQLTPADKLKEAKDAYRTLQLHRDKIMDYESRYGVKPDGTVNANNQIAAANNDYGLTGANAVHTLVASLDPAKMTILADLGANANPDITAAYQKWVVMPGNDPLNFLSTNLYLDPGRNSAKDTASPFHSALLDARQYDANGNEIVSNDILIGEGGDAGLGVGGDMLVGGGHDIIEDKLGNNRVFLNGKVLFEFSTSDGINYLSADGAFSGVMSNGDFIVTDIVTGDKVTLNKNFQSGDFGITLKTAAQAPAQTVTTRDIVGDFGPMDFRDANGNVVYQYDDLGNLVTDPNKAGPRNDVLNDGAGNDHVMSGAGDEVIYLKRGGDDIVDAGTGDDFVMKTAAGNLTATLGDGADKLFNYSSAGTTDVDGGWGRDWIEGGANADRLQGGMDADNLAGGAGDDRLYGSIEIATDQAIAAGNADIASGLKGDWLAGNAGDDILVTREGNDVLTGGGGNDLLIAGAGDDFIAGDAEYSAQSLDWTVAPDASGTYIFQPVVGVAEPADSGNDVKAGEAKENKWNGVACTVFCARKKCAANDAVGRFAA